MIRNGWWCPDHGYYDLGGYSGWCEFSGNFVPLGAVVEYSSSPKELESKDYFYLSKKVESVHVFRFKLFGRDAWYYCNIKDLKEFEDNLPSGLLFNCSKTE